MYFALGIDAKKMTAAFNRAPLIVARELRIELSKALRAVQTDAREHHQYHTKSGMANRSIQYSVEKTGLAGKVGIDKKIAKYPIYLHEGTKPHTIKPKEKKSLYFVRKGQGIFASIIRHPGIRRDQFLYKAFNRQRSYIVARMRAAVDRAFKMAGVK